MEDNTSKRLKPPGPVCERVTLGSDLYALISFRLPNIFISQRPCSAKGVQSCILERDYAYIWNLTNMDKLELKAETTFNMYQGASLLSLENSKHGDVFVPVTLIRRLSF